MELRVINVYPETVSDGFGIRFSVYFAGCSHHCPGCHNPQSWNPHAGELLDGDLSERILSQMEANPLLDGVTFSGGDPLFNPEEFLKFLKRVKERTGLNVWCYTGYVYENLLNDPKREPCLHFIDVLVDGPFKKELLEPRLYFRGSKNQRIIYLKDGRMEHVASPEAGDF
ncbi:MAG: anaerobic ribonucleoside-triphosphate reductase activating protein [Opitutales bacterium]|nr:anaerobic ribonucleoside-triphosphate reductase activating protein [Opitutales bacterium]